jgi:crotonobetaine/carnitine-CoA ligase
MLTYPEFTPTFPREHWTVPYVLEHQAKVRPESPFLSWTDAGKPHSFGEVNAIANRIARGFAKLGVKKGDFVVILLPNCLEYMFSFYGLSKLGAIEVTIGDAYKGEFLRHQVALTKAKIVITTPEIAPRLAEVEAGLAEVEHVILLDDAEWKDIPPTKFQRFTTSKYSELYEKDASNLGIPVSPRDIAAVLFTSGTTGLSKGVLMTHSQFHFFAAEDVQLVGLEPHDVYMTGFPLFHGNAQFLTVYPCLIVGAHCVLYRKFSASDFFGRARRSGATVCNLLGATMSFLCAQPPSPDDKAHKISRIYAAPLSFDLAGVFTERFGVSEFLDGFGQTEISNVFMTPRGAKRPSGASGVAVSQYFDVRLVDPDTDEEVPEGEIGELVVRHKLPFTISNGYVGLPEKNVETWRNLWFHTGDALRRDANGWYYFVDRVKDCLRRRGENISSFEVESVVRSFPAVAECAVIGVQADEKAGEDEVKACIVLKPGETVSFEELVRWCDKRMPAFMVPRYFEIFVALPQTPSEKIRKKELRERGITPETWDRVRAGILLETEKKRA